MGLHFTNTDEALLRGQKYLVHGEAGAGKTRMISTLVDGGHSPVILSHEGGTLSLRDYSIPVIEVSSIKDVRDAFKFIRSSTEAEGFDWVCVDSLSEILEVLLADLKKGVTDPRQAYGEVIDDGLDLVRSFRDLPRNVYFSAKQEFGRDEGGRSFFRASAPGQQLPQKLPYLFDEVFTLRVFEEDGEVQRCLQTSADGRYSAKDRSGALELFEPADLSHIASKITGDFKAAPRPTEEKGEAA